jgi:hypothetical protein
VLGATRPARRGTKVRALCFDTYLKQEEQEPLQDKTPGPSHELSAQGLPSSRLYPVSLLLAFLIQRLEPGKHLSVPGEGRVVDLRRTPF